VIFKTF